MYTLDIRKTNRKSLALEIKEPGSLIVRAPFWARDKDINAMIESNKDWIEQHMQMVEERAQKKANIKRFSKEEIENLANRALIVIPQKVEYFAREIGVSYGRITIRNQKTRWGSCSSKGNLNFNCLLMLAPETVQDYVVVHELCHRIEMNHSKQFWKLVEEILPEYKKEKKWLKEHGSELIERL